MSSGSPSSNNMLQAQLEAVERARAALANADLDLVCRRTGLTRRADGTLDARLLGRELYFCAGDVRVCAADSLPVSPTEELLVLRYLASDREIVPTGELITHRDLPGGSFYLQPVLNRTSGMVLAIFGNNIEALQRAIERYPHRRLKPGDLAAAIPAVGRLEITLVYRLGDDEFPPSLDILYDRAIATVYHTDEVAALAGWLCRGLIRDTF